MTTGAFATPNMSQPASTIAATLPVGLLGRIARMFQRTRPEVPSLRILGRQSLTPSHTMFVVSCDAQRFVAVAHPTGVALWPLGQGAAEMSERS